VPEGQYCPDLVMSRRCEAVGRDRLLLAQAGRRLAARKRSEPAKGRPGGALSTLTGDWRVQIDADCEADVHGARHLSTCLLRQAVLCDRHAAGDTPTDFLNARLKAASDS
jgi:hypothetical protein